VSEAGAAPSPPASPSAVGPPIVWRAASFGELALADLHDVLQLRQRVFAVEQKSIYLDVDGRDPAAVHVLGRAHDELVAYARFFAPGVRYAEASLGRVVVAEERRHTGLGRDLVARVLAEMDRRLGRASVRISAQSHLQRFYGGFGFVTEGGEYDEDGIPHVAMVRPA